jgi:hypothetical protein
MAKAIVAKNATDAETTAAAHEAILRIGSRAFLEDRRKWAATAALSSVSATLRNIINGAWSSNVVHMQNPLCPINSRLASSPD